MDYLENNKTETDENQNDTPHRTASLQKSVERRVSVADQENNFKYSYNDWDWNSDFKEIIKNKEIKEKGKKKKQQQQK